jgi:hypothetical protein
MGQILILLCIVTFVTIGTAFLEMFVLCDQFLVYQKTLVVFFRLNWRRRPCSPLRFTGRYLGQLAKLFQSNLVCMTVNTSVFVFCRGRRGYGQKKNQEK